MMSHFIRAWSSLPELENSMSFSYFSKTEPEKTRSLKIAKTRTRKKPQKLELGQIHFWTIENFAKKRCISAKFWSKFSLKPINSKIRVWSQYFLTQKTQTQKILEFWNPKNSNPLV